MNEVRTSDQGITLGRGSGLVLVAGVLYPGQSFCLDLAVGQRIERGLDAL